MLIADKVQVGCFCLCLCLSDVGELDIGRVLTEGGHPVNPVPKLKDLLIHPSLNVATVLLVVSTHRNP